MGGSGMGGRNGREERGGFYGSRCHGAIWKHKFLVFPSYGTATRQIAGFLAQIPMIVTRPSDVISLYDNVTFSPCSILLLMEEVLSGFNSLSLIIPIHLYGSLCLTSL